MPRRAHRPSWASSRAPRGRARARSGSSTSQPAAWSTDSAVGPASSMGRAAGDPLCMMARRKSPAAAGVPMRVPTLMAPADSPNTVTFPGSPPKASMLSRTQVRAAIWSSRPQLPAAPDSGSRSTGWARKPRAPRR